MSREKVPAAQKTNKSADATRGSLIKVATREFAQRGFSAVSTRELAKAANVNLAAIPYHFGGKKELYHAVLDTIVEEAQACCGVTARQIHCQLEAGPITLAVGNRLIQDLVQTILSFLVGKGEGRHRATLIIHELTTQTEGFQRLYKGYMQQVHVTATRLFAALLHEKADSPESILRAHALLGQMVFFSAGRELIKARTDGKEFTQKRLDEIAEVVTETLTASIHAMREMRGIQD